MHSNSKLAENLQTKRLELERWIRKINSTHSGFDQGRWDKQNHYIFVLKVTVFEFGAQGCLVEQKTGTFHDVVSQITQDLHIIEPININTWYTALVYMTKP